MYTEKNDFILYDKGKVDKRLKTTVKYSFTAIDVHYSEITKTVQIMYDLEHSHTREIFNFFEEFDPLSKRFKKLLDRTCYINESYATKPVYLEDLYGVAFDANLQYVNGKLCIDLDTTEPSVSSMSPMLERYEENGFIIY